jgi:hypothetical protein
VSPDRIRQLLDTDTRNNLIICCHLQKSLIKDIVFEIGNERWNVSDYVENIEFVAFYGVIGEKNIVKLQIEEMVTHYSHHFVSLHVVHV